MSSNFRIAMPVALLIASAPGVRAQPAAAPVPVAPPASAASTSAMGYRSAFDGYRSFKDQPVRSWREANDLVGQIGGWQAYAREAQGGPPAAPRAASQSMTGHKMP